MNYVFFSFQLLSSCFRPIDMAFPLLILRHRLLRSAGSLVIITIIMQKLPVAVFRTPTSVVRRRRYLIRGKNVLKRKIPSAEYTVWIAPGLFFAYAQAITRAIRLGYYYYLFNCYAGRLTAKLRRRQEVGRVNRVRIFVGHEIKSIDPCHPVR